MTQKHFDAVLIFCANSECTNQILSELIDVYKTNIYSYNTVIKKYGVYLKPVHIVVKKDLNGTKIYHYYARYWYKVVYNSGKLKWIYLGKEKPLTVLPDPPLNPFTAIKVINDENSRSCVYVDNINIVSELYNYLVEVLNKIKCTDIFVNNALNLRSS